MTRAVYMAGICDIAHCTIRREGYSVRMTEAVHDHAYMTLYRVERVDGWWQLRRRSESLFKAVRRIGEENEIP